LWGIPYCALIQNSNPVSSDNVSNSRYSETLA
jgi:hypothetical protein